MRTPGNWELRAEEVADRLLGLCQVKMTLLCHSMGNYLMKKSVGSSGSQLAELVFDNICMVAADTNIAGHATWVEKLDVRNQLYIAINERDFALAASRIKPGEEQRARLGNRVKGLDASNADYIDVTGEPGVNASHAYFKRGPVGGNPGLRQLFDHILNASPAHEVRALLDYQPAINCHRLR